MYLIDTNIWLERLLEQDKSSEVATLLNIIPTNEIVISDFSFHSIGIIMTKLSKDKEFLIFVDDLFKNAKISYVSLSHLYMKELLQSIRNYGLDFDDAYQLVCAEIYNLEIITYDKDFNKNDIKVFNPSDIIKKYL